MNPWGVDVPAPTESEFFNAARPTTFLFVEGGSDERFWRNRVEPHLCIIRIAGNRNAALKELQSARSEGRSGFVAILDADFDRIEGSLLHDPDVVWTDHHDLEVTLLASSALIKVLAESASKTKYEHFQHDEKSSVLKSVLEMGTELGRLRLLSKREGLGLIFRKLTPSGEFKYLNYSGFCDKSTWKVRRDLMLKTVVDFSSRHSLSVDDLSVKLDDVPGFDPLQGCVGHDLIGLLVVGLRSVLGNRNFQIEELQERFRLAFEWDDLISTSMYSQLVAWEQRNGPYRVLPKKP